MQKITDHPHTQIPAFNQAVSALKGQDLLYEDERNMPGSIHYSIKRFRRKKGWNLEDTGAIVYYVEKNNPGSRYLELRFCVTGNMYCREKQALCDQCKLKESAECLAKTESVDLLRFSFTPSYLQQFIRGEKENINLSDKVISFELEESFSRTLPLCPQTRLTLNALLNHNYTDTFANIFVNAQMQILLLYSMDCMLGAKNGTGIKSKFLANEEDREKIIKARSILLEHIGEPITIKTIL